MSVTDSCFQISSNCFAPLNDENKQKKIQNWDGHLESVSLGQNLGEQQNVTGSSLAHFPSSYQFRQNSPSRLWVIQLTKCPTDRGENTTC